MRIKKVLVLMISLMLLSVFTTFTPNVYAASVYNLSLDWSTTTPSQVRSVFVGDVDGDGDNELITGEGDASHVGIVRVFEYSSGTFTLAWSHSFEADLPDGGTSVWGLAVGDVDNDGENELVIGNRHSRLDGLPVGGQVHVFENVSGDEYIEVWNDYVGDVITVTIGDVDNDGLNEILVSNMGGAHLGTVVYDHVSGNEYARTWSSDQIVDTCEHENFVADTDNDGLNELVICGLSYTAVLEQNSDGGYIVAWQTPISTSWGKGSVFVEDADNDGENELLIAESVWDPDTGAMRTLRVYDYNAETGDYNLTWASPSVSSGIPYSGLFAGDVDNDGRNEIVLNWQVYKHIGYTYEPIFDTSGLYGHPVFIADADNDGENEWITQPYYVGIAVCSLSITLIPATIDIDPDTLNLWSKGEWITCYIELPESYNVSDIDVSTILLNDTVPAEWSDIQDDVLMVKFNRAAVISLLNVGNQTVKITGELTDGTPFEGTDMVRAIHAQITLTDVHTIHLDVDGAFLQGENLKVKFYSYSGTDQGETTVWSGTTPAQIHLSLGLSQNSPIENAILILTDNEETILNLVNFVVHRSDLFTRLAQRDTEWAYASPSERTAIFKENIAIDMQWPYAPP